MNLSKYIGCISSIFNVIKGKALKSSDIIELTYKRVSVFQVMNSIKSFITVKRQNGVELVDLINELVENFPKEIEDEERAKVLIQEWNSEVQQKLDSYGNKSRMIDSNPGFNTILESDVKAEKTFTILNIYDINDVNYIKHIDVYAAGIFTILQKKSSLSEDLQEQLHSLCSKITKRIANIENVSDIKADKEQKSGKLVFVNQVEGDDDDDDDDDDFFDETDSDEDDEEGDDDDEEDGDDDDEENFNDEIVTLPVANQGNIVADVTPLSELTRQPSSELQESVAEEKIESVKTPEVSRSRDVGLNVEDIPEKTDSPSPLVEQQQDKLEEKDEDTPPAISLGVEENTQPDGDSQPRETPQETKAETIKQDELEDEEEDELEDEEEDELEDEEEDELEDEEEDELEDEEEDELEDEEEDELEDEEEDEPQTQQEPEKSLESVSSIEDLSSLEDLSSIEDDSISQSKTPEESVVADESNKSVSEVANTEKAEDTYLNIDDELEEIETDSDEDTMGGGGKEDEMDIDLSNLALSGAKNIFMKRLREREPELFIKKNEGGYHSYSRSCPTQYKKQPIIIDDEEKAYIDARDKESGVKSYDESIRYGTGEKKYNYICPRFWCIRDNKGKGRSLSLKQINDGECGGWNALIPEGAKKVPPGKRIVEFVTERFHRENVKNTEKGDPARRLIYRPMYPGFQDTDKHPKGLCVPCCFQGAKQQIYETFTDENGKTKYRIIKTGEISDSPPKIPYMYKPRPKPTYKTDKEGNIILDSIEGEQYERQNGTQNEAYGMCNQPKPEENEYKTQEKDDEDEENTQGKTLTKKRK